MARLRLRFDLSAILLASSGGSDKPSFLHTAYNKEKHINERLKFHNGVTSYSTCFYPWRISNLILLEHHISKKKRIYRLKESIRTIIYPNWLLCTCKTLTTSSTAGAGILTPRHRLRMAGMTLDVEFAQRISLQVAIYFSMVRRRPCCASLVSLSTSVRTTTEKFIYLSMKNLYVQNSNNKVGSETPGMKKHYH